MKSKHTTLALISYLFITCGAFAQKDSSGIYKTVDDFKNQKLSYAINYKTEHHKINSYALFKDNVIKVKHHGTVYNLVKSETYGYRNTSGIEYRFVGDQEYKILNHHEGLLIYVYQHPSHSPKEATKYAPMYFFSTDAAAAPQELTKANLKAAFPENHKLHDAIDAQFKSDNELYAYDNFNKIYKLNRIINNNDN